MLPCSARRSITGRSTNASRSAARSVKASSPKADGSVSTVTVRAGSGSGTRARSAGRRSMGTQWLRSYENRIVDHAAQRDLVALGGTREVGVEQKAGAAGVAGGRSEEHTSELQSLRHLVCRLL